MSLREDIRESLTRGLPRALILREDYQIDGHWVPCAQPLQVTAWGRDKSGITYDVPGWDLLVETDEFLIVSQGDRSWAIPRALRHDKLMVVGDDDVDSLVELVESFVDRLGGCEPEEEDLWGEEPDGGW